MVSELIRVAPKSGEAFLKKSIWEGKGVIKEV